jgi:hypothetical protein
MSVKYIRFTVQIHGLNLARESDAELLRLAIKKTVESVHPAGEANIYDNDVSVEMDEFAGRFDTEDVSQPAVPEEYVLVPKVMTDSMVDIALDWFVINDAEEADQLWKLLIDDALLSAGKEE